MTIFKNYYQVLGLPDFADVNAVKAAFRQLARQHHPDLNAGTREAEERFKEINEAYETLNDADKRRRHDVLLKAMQGGGTAKPSGKRAASAYTKSQTEDGKSASKAEKNASSSPKSQTDSSKTTAKSESAASPPPTSTPIGDFFENFMRKGASDGKPKGVDGKSADEDGIFRKKREQTASSQEKPKRGEDVVVKTAISPVEAMEGVVKTVQVQHHEICRRCSATGKVNGAVCPVCQGEKVQTRTKKIDVRIPARVKQNSRVRVAKEGGRGLGGAENGDLFLQIEIVYDSSLRIEGLDVYGDVALSVTDAVLGGEIEVSTLNGSMTMAIPPGTQTGRIFRLKERGVQSGLAKGDHFVTVNVVIPENLTARERELYEELARLRPEKPTLKKTR